MGNQTRVGNQTACKGNQFACVGNQTRVGNQTACVGNQTHVWASNRCGQSNSMFGQSKRQSITCVGNQTACVGNQTACVGNQACVGLN